MHEYLFPGISGGDFLHFFHWLGAVITCEKIIGIKDTPVRAVIHRAMRMVHYATWLARRWHDPVFPATWPDFGNEGYWSQETQDLEEQLDLIRRATDNTYQPVQEEETLSNADIFWDWEG